MPWIVLVISGVLEAVWATALGQSDGLNRPLPVVIFVVALTASMVGLGQATRHIPIGTGYAVWVGIGASLTVAYAMVTGAEEVSVAKIVFLAGIIVAIVGLKLVHDPRHDSPEPAGD